MLLARRQRQDLGIISRMSKLPEALEALKLKIFDCIGLAPGKPFRSKETHPNKWHGNPSISANFAGKK